MRSFTDSTGREWTLAITVEAIKRVKAALDIDLANVTEGEPPLLTRLGTDVMLLCDTVFVLVEPQAKERGVSDVEFGSAMGGGAIAAAYDAFWEELRDFFQQLRRSDVAKAIEKQTAMVEAAVSLADHHMDQIDVERVAQTTFGEPSTSSPVLSESIPDRSP